jgi:Tfp pilus assembly protein PilF
MTSRQLLWAGLASLTVLAGCQSVESKQKLTGNRSANPMEIPDTGKLSSKQAADVQVALGRSMEAENPDGAAQAYREAIRRDPSRSDAYRRLAILHDLQGKFQESADFYQKALEAKPGDPLVFCDKGYSFYLQRRWAEAEMNLKQALAIKPDLDRAHNNLGLVLAHNNQADAALAEFRKAGCSPSDAQANLAYALTLEGKVAEAKNRYVQALTLNPKSEVAKSGLETVKGLLAQNTPRQPAPSSPAQPTRRPAIGDPAVRTASVQIDPRTLPPLPASPAFIQASTLSPKPVAMARKTPRTNPTTPPTATP